MRSGRFRASPSITHLSVRHAWMDLQLEGRIDSDRDMVAVIDSTPLGDNLLDPVCWPRLRNRKTTAMPSARWHASRRTRPRVASRRSRDELASESSLVWPRMVLPRWRGTQFDLGATRHQIALSTRKSGCPPCAYCEIPDLAATVHPQRILRDHSRQLQFAAETTCVPRPC